MNLIPAARSWHIAAPACAAPRRSRSSNRLDSRRCTIWLAGYWPGQIASIPECPSTKKSVEADASSAWRAYILHMVRMMMWDCKTGDQNFKATMQDFVRTYAGRAATTEDFKAVVEKHMTPEMAAFGGGNMDWFVDEYVYGTALPSYNMQFTFDNDASGDVLFGLKLTQSNVNEHFRILVPIYLELADGRTIQLGRARLTGKTTLEQKIALKGTKEKTAACSS